MIAEQTQYDTRHGGPFDRGSADSYYNREYSPHYYTGDTYNSNRIDLKDMTAAEITAYTAGYNENEESSNKKAW